MCHTSIMTRKQWLPIYFNIAAGKQKIEYIVTTDGKRFPAQWVVHGRFRTFKTHYWVAATDHCLRMNCTSKDPKMYHVLIHEGLPIEQIKFVKLY